MEAGRARWLVAAAAIAILASGSARGLVITEIMYNPPGPGEALEFIELYNEKPTPEDLSGYRFTRGIHYAFPSDIGPDGLPVSVLGPRAYLVLAADRDAFVARYGFEPFGVYEGKLANEGERIVLENDAGDPEGVDGRIEGGRIISLQYNDRGAWYTETDGTGHSLCLIDPFGDPKDPKNWLPSPTLWGTPGRANGFTDEWIEAVIVEQGTEWRYRKGTSEPPSNWAARTFDDAGWSVGSLPLGYGEPGLKTTLSDMRGSYVSVHLRRRFAVADPSRIESLVLSVNYDDGFVAYLNGTEVARANISGTRPAYNARAASAIEPAGLVPFDITSYASLLVAGENVLAIQIHNASLSDSSDLLIDARLASRRVVRGGRMGRALLVNEALYTGPGERWVEIHNASDEAIELAGFYLSTDPSALDAHPLSGTIPARGFRAFREAPTLPLELRFAGPDDPGTLRIFLTSIDPGDPSATRVVAAKAFDGDVEEGSSVARIPDGSPNWFEVTTPTEGQPNRAAPGDIVTSIVIDEIMYHPFREDDAFRKDDDGLYGDDLEYIELYNRGAEPVDLLGFRFTKGIDFAFARSTVIPPGGYLVLAKNPARIEEIYGISGVQGPYGGVLADGGELLRLKDPRGNTVDEVEYADGGHWDRWADGGGSSLELIDPRQDNASPSAWKASDESGKSQWFRVSYSGIHDEFGRGGESEFHLYLLGAGEILIDDLKVSPNASFSPNLIRGGDFADASTYGYWIKSNDTGGTHIDSHWTDADGHAAAGCLKVVASGRGDTGFNRLEQDTTQALTSGQRYYVEYWARWLRGTNLVLTRTLGHGVAQASAIPVPERLGTPGARNSAWRANQGPVFFELSQRPVVPNPSEPVAVTIRVSDADGVAGVWLHFRDDAQPSFQSVSMLDDGAHGDGAAGDGVYGGTIPGFPNGTIVEFYVRARDGLGEETEFPPPIPPGSPATVLPDRAVYRVGDRLSGSALPVYRIVMTHAVQAELDRRRNLSNHLVPGTFILNDERIFYNIGMRFRGSPFIRGDGNGSYSWSGIRIRFPSDAKLMGSIEELNLDASGATNQHDRTAYYMERKIGASLPGVKVPWSWGTYVQMRFKAGDRENVGTYDHVQKVDKEYATYWWRDDDRGQIHKVDDWFEFYSDGASRNNWQAAMTYYGENENRYREQFKIRSRELFDDFSPLIGLCRDLTASAADSVILSQMDVRQWVALLSVRFFIDDWDTLGISRGKNAYLYLPAQDHRWMLIPWDSDLTFSNTAAQIYPGGAFPQLQKLFQRPWVRRWLHADYRYIIEEIVESGRLGAWLRAVAETPGVGGTELENWCLQRAQNIRSRIPDDSRTPFEITSPPASPHMTDQTVVTFAGRAPYRADLVFLNGERIDGELRWTDSDGLRWAYDYEVLKGSQILVFRALSRDGGLVGERTIEVVGLSEPPPKVTGVSPAEGLSVGGLRVTIAGQRFEGGAKVFFDASEAPWVEFVSSTQLRAETPPHAPGVVVVTVENPNGIRGSFLGFTYLPEPPPRVAYVHPDRGWVGGGTAVQIRGSYFQPGCRVTFGGIEAAGVVRLSELELIAIAPARPAGEATVPVRVTNRDTQWSEIVGFAYLASRAPEISSVEPREGPRAGGTWVTIRGSGFQSGLRVRFGPRPAAALDRRSAAEVRALSPAADGAATWVGLYLENPDGQYAWLAQGFRYLPAGKSGGSGDANGDGRVDLADAIRILEYLFLGRALASPEAADWTGDGRIDIADAIALASDVTGGA